MATLHGKNATIYLGSGGVAIPLSEAAEWTLDVDFDTVDDGAFGDTAVTLLKGRLKESGSLAGNYDDASTLAWDAATYDGSVNMYIYPTRAVTTNYYYGSVYPKLSLSGSLTDKVKFSGSFEVNGAISKKP